MSETNRPEPTPENSQVEELDSSTASASADQPDSDNATTAEALNATAAEAYKVTAAEAPDGQLPESELAGAQEEIAKLKDAFMRAKAEEDNVRRRSEREMANSRKFAVEGFAKEILNVHDSLKLASLVEVAQDADDTVKSIHEGVQITLKQLDSALAKFAVIEIAAEIGDKLDPNLHQAMSLIQSETVESGCIINVIQPGFTLHDRLLRPSLVVVAK